MEFTVILSGKTYSSIDMTFPAIPPDSKPDNVNDTPQDDYSSLPLSRLVRGELGIIFDSDVFIRTLRGQREALERTRELPHRIRMLLMLIDGRRSVGAFRAAMTNFRSLDETLDMLIKMSLIERLPSRLDD